MTTPDSQPASATPDPVSPLPLPENPRSVPLSADARAALAADIKNRLEYTLAGKTVTVRFKDRTLEFKRWGLRKQLQMGSKVISLVQRVRTVIPEDEQETLFSDPALVAQVLSFMADDVISIIAGSLSAPFKTMDEAEKWLDSEVEDLNDLFDLGYIVWEMNLKEGGLGKLTGGVNSLAQKMMSLSTASSKN